MRCAAGGIKPAYERAPASVSALEQLVERRITLSTFGLQLISRNRFTWRLTRMTIPDPGTDRKSGRRTPDLDSAEIFASRWNR